MNCKKTDIKRFRCLQGAAIKSKTWNSGFSSDNMIHSERITSWMFWCVGALYTAHIIATSITRFFKYPSIITARNGISGRYPNQSAS